MKYLLLVLLTLFVVTACQTNNAQTVQNALGIENDSVPTRRDLRVGYWEKRELLIVYGAKENALKEQYEELLGNLAVQGQRRNNNLTITYTEASKIKEEDIQNSILFLLGNNESNPVIARLTKNLPITFLEKGISFLGKEFKEKEDFVSVRFFPNPENHKLPFSFLYGMDDREIFDFLKQKIEEGRFLFWQNMDYEVYSNKNRVMMGNFNAQWFADGKTHFDYSTGNDTIYKSKNFNFIAHQKPVEEKYVRQIATALESTAQAIFDFVGSGESVQKINYHMYGTAEDKGLMTGNTDRAHLDLTDRSVHIVINEIYSENFIGKENELLIADVLPVPDLPMFKRGLPLYFTDQWQKEGYLYWGARLTESKNALSFGQLLDNAQLESESPLIADCMLATATSFLIKKWGQKKFLEKYQKWTPDKEEISKLEPQWNAYLLSLTGQFKKKKRKPKETPYLKGFNFAHEGYGIYNGYGSRKAVEALEKQKALGANAIAIVPYSFMRSDSIPRVLPISNGAGSENDSGIVHSAREAQRMGMQVLMKPQVFFGNSWPGALDMKNEKDWELFFEHYYKWIRHYAFLSEIHQIDMLSVGVEFAIATLTHEKKWRGMFRKIKGLYQGKLTYSANWGKEFENVRFWDELDFIGLNSYYPLSKNDKVTDAELRENFKKVKQKIKQVSGEFNKPVVFTEIGFRSMDSPWKNPHAEGNGSFNELDQQRCYEVIFEGIQGEPWCHGILWWKFPSYLEYRGNENDAFTPNNKITEQTIKKWF